MNLEALDKLYMGHVPGVRRILGEIKANLEAWYKGTLKKDGDYFRQTSWFLTDSNLIELVACQDSISVKSYRRSNIIKTERHFKVAKDYMGHLELKTEQITVLMANGEEIILPLPEGYEEDWDEQVNNFVRMLDI